mgnify:CR=1 FL=1
MLKFFLSAPGDCKPSNKMEIKEIKSRLSMEQVLRHYGIEITRNGHIRCPFHEDRQASMRVYPSTNTVYCFAGSCSTHGHSLDVIDFIMKTENCTKHDAILKAGAMAGLEVLPQAEEKPKRTAQNLTLEEVFATLRRGLTLTLRAQEYAANRGLDYLKMEIGYNSGQLHHRKTSEYLSDLEALNIIKARDLGGYTLFAKDCIIFPLKDSLIAKLV